MPITRVDELPTPTRNGAGRPAAVHPEGDELLAAGPGKYLVEKVEHDGTEEGLKAAKNKVQALTRQLKNVDTSVKVRSITYGDAINVYAIVMDEDEEAAYYADLEERAARKAEKLAAEADEDEDDTED